MFSTIVALILRIFSNPIANVYQKKLAEKHSVLSTNFYAYFALSLCCIPFALKVQWALLPSEFWFYSIFAGFLCSCGTACLIGALKCGELSVLAPINSYKSIIGMITAIFVLHEIPNIIGLLGVILIIWGSSFVFDTTDEGFSFKLFKRKDIQLRFLALFLTGIEAALLKKVILLSSPEISFMLWCFAGAFFALVFIFLTKRIPEKITKIDFHKYIIIAICLGIMQLSTNFVFKKIDVGFALALFQLSVLINLFFGYKIFHEKNIIKKLIGTIIMIIGSILIIMNV